MNELIDKYLAAMQAQQKNTTEMTLRCDGAIQVLTMMKNELAETHDVERPALSAPAPEPDPAVATHADFPRSTPRPAARKRATKKRGAD